MPLNVIVVMDPIAHIKIAKDTTFAMLLKPSAAAAMPCTTCDRAAWRWKVTWRSPDHRAAAGARRPGRLV